MNGSVRLLDVNVPMYAAGEEHPYKRSCSWLMQELAEGRLNAAIDVEMIQEILYRYGSLHLWDIATTLATTLLDLAPVVYPVVAADVRLAVDLFRHYAPNGVRARDLLHVAVMQNNGLTEIISTDQHFDQIVGIARLDPEQLFRQARNLPT